MKSLLNFFLIDDSAFDLFIYEKLLIKSGITDSVKTFNSAREALKFLMNQGNAIPDTIILLDLQMPDMNGFEFIDEFETLPDHLRSKIRIFMLSSTIDTRDIEKVRANPHIIDLLPKPLEVTFLKKKLAI
ncbi:response regulator [Dyadobacter crusticola]|uniref:response regulator n=1 Tax=Dyadobacter crusticola TaxID=292407 RepID=UPI0004E2186A|nr:response regulator [Dyadobacter crusticola]